MAAQRENLNPHVKDLIVTHVRHNSSIRTCEQYFAMILRAGFKPSVTARILWSGPKNTGQNQRFGSQNRNFEE